LTDERVTEAAVHPPVRSNIASYAALTAAYCTHAGFFNPFLPLWLKDLGLSIAVISVLTAVQSATRMFAPYAWGALSDRTGERAKLLR
jgi:PPP family 3-phenylpropionic acid transporter